MSSVDDLQQAGPYQLTTLMGTNGIVATWSATDSSGNPKVVVVMSREHLTDPAWWGKVEQAVQALQSAQPGGVLIPEMCGQEGGVYFTAYPFLEGVHLGKNVNEHGLPGPQASVNIAIQILQILSNLQAAGITHRVLTPASIFLSPDGQVTLLHGGWSNVLLAAPEGPLNEAMMSNLPFLAPEVIAYEPSELPADVYSLGANLYFLLSGQPTHWEDDPNVLGQQIQSADIDFSVLQQAVGEDLADLVEEMLERDPEDRPPNLEALMNRFQMALDSLPAAQEMESFSEMQTMQQNEMPGDDTQPPVAGSAPPPPLPPLPDYNDHQPVDEGEYQSGSGPSGEVAGEQEGESPLSAAEYRSRQKRSKNKESIHKAQQVAAEAVEAKRLEEERQKQQDAEKARLKLEQKKKMIKMGIMGAAILLVVVVIGGIGLYGYSLLAGEEDNSEAIRQAAIQAQKEKEEREKEAELERTMTADTEATLENLGELSRSYYQKFGVWPRVAGDFGDLTETMPEMQDAWGNDLQVRPGGFIMSPGEDGEFETGDDFWMDSENSEIVYSSEI